MTSIIYVDTSFYYFNFYYVQKCNLVLYADDAVLFFELNTIYDWLLDNHLITNLREILLSLFFIDYDRNCLNHLNVHLCSLLMVSKSPVLMNMSILEIRSINR